jgi:hypothetical protein
VSGLPAGAAEAMALAVAGGLAVAVAVGRGVVGSVLVLAHATPAIRGSAPIHLGQAVVRMASP